RVEQAPEPALTRRLLSILAETFGQPLAALQVSLQEVKISRWEADELAQGSYSFLPLGATPADRQALAEPHGRRLLRGGALQQRVSLHGAWGVPVGAAGGTAGVAAPALESLGELGGQSGHLGRFCARAGSSGIEFRLAPLRGVRHRSWHGLRRGEVRLHDAEAGQWIARAAPLRARPRAQRVVQRRAPGHQPPEPAERGGPGGARRARGGAGRRGHGLRVALALSRAPPRGFAFAAPRLAAGVLGARGAAGGGVQSRLFGGFGGGVGGVDLRKGAVAAAGRGVGTGGERHAAQLPCVPAPAQGLVARGPLAEAAQSAGAAPGGVAQLGAGGAAQRRRPRAPRGAGRRGKGLAGGAAAGAAARPGGRPAAAGHEAG
ncbi:unnamed protein product, partial [Effrenium voratum]